MTRRFIRFGLVSLGGLMLAGCGSSMFSAEHERPAWRKQAEAQCMARGEWKALLSPAKLPQIDYARLNGRTPVQPQFTDLPPSAPGTLPPVATFQAPTQIGPRPLAVPGTASSEPAFGSETSIYDLDLSTAAEDEFHKEAAKERGAFAEDEIITNSIFPQSGMSWPRAITTPAAPITPVKMIDGPGNCGADTPLRVSAVPVSGVEFSSPVPLTCPTTLSVGRWLVDVVQPAAYAAFGQSVQSMLVMGSYSCRTIMRNPRASMSEHAYANALDVAGFILQDGTRVTVKRDWRAPDSRSQFLRQVHAGACGMFSTTLGPEANAAHENHLHIDMASRRGGRKYCK